MEFPRNLSSDPILRQLSVLEAVTNAFMEGKSDIDDAFTAGFVRQVIDYALVASRFEDSDKITPKVWESIMYGTLVNVFTGQICINVFAVQSHLPQAAAITFVAAELSCLIEG